MKEHPPVKDKPSKQKQAMLLVEDNPADAQLFRAAIQKTGTYQQVTIDWAQRLQDALQLLKTQEYIFIICDLSLPDCNRSHKLYAFETLQSIAKDIPIVILTGNWSKELATEAINRGAQDYLCKSTLYDSKQLWRCLSFAVERHAMQLKLKKKADDLLEARKQAEAASQAKSLFLANVSHELRTPLNSLIILSQILSQNNEGNLTSEQLEFAKTIHTSGNDLLTVINDILDLSKVEAGKIEVEMGPLLVKDLIHSLQAQFKPIAHKKGLSLNVVSASNLPFSFESDSHKVKQILTNLIANAIKFTETGSVTLRITRDRAHTLETTESAIVFEVIDTGIGIPKEQLKTIFEPFQQADVSTSRKYGGTGLGLTISKEMSQLLGGTLKLNSVVGQGSQFSLYLPMVSEQQTPKKESPPPPPESTRAERISNNVRRTPPDQPLDIEKPIFLVIDDDPVCNEIIREVSLAQHYRCLSATNGASGIEQAITHKPDHILLDLILPDIRGEAVLKKLRETPETRKIPVSVITSNSIQKSKFYRLGASRVFNKPIDSDAINELLFRNLMKIRKKCFSILIVDKDLTAMRVLSGLIYARFDIQCTCANLGENALEIVTNNPFDCIIMDLEFEDMDGLELLKSVKQNSCNRAVSTIVYTFKSLDSNEKRALRKYTEWIFIKGLDKNRMLLRTVIDVLLHAQEPVHDTAVKDALTVESDHSLAGTKVLLVDDDLRNAFSISKVLEQEGFEVLLADNGQLALEKLESTPNIDIVFMDIMMPILNGYETICKIRQQPKFTELPIIAVTADAMTDVREKCLRSGANEYMTKPIQIESLKSLIQKHLNREIIALDA